MRNIGKISETVLKRSVMKPIEQNKVGIIGASTGLDCAFFGENGIATGYVAYKDTKACRHAIIQACNNLIAQNCEPEIINLSISMPDCFREIKLKEIMKQACDIASELGLKIAGGHTEFVQNLTTPVISVTSIGKKKSGGTACAKPAGLDIVMTKWMGLLGTSVIASEKREELITRLPAYYVDEAAGLDQFATIEKETDIAFSMPETHIAHDVAGGGIYTALWEICSAMNCGCCVDLRKIPVLQETIEVCEFFDISPYNLRGDGSLLIFTSDGDALVEKLKSEEILGTVIGHTTDNIDKVVIRDEETRFLEPGNGDELLKVLY